MTNPIRPDAAASLLTRGEARKSSGTLQVGGESDAGAHQVVGDGTPGRHGGISGETCRRGDVGRSQSLHSTDAAKAAQGAGSKTALREGRQEGGCMKAGKRQSNGEAPQVPCAKQGVESCLGPRDWSWVEASIWTESMLAALDNGVKGGKWFSLIDKMVRPGPPRLRTLS